VYTILRRGPSIEPWTKSLVEGSFCSITTFVAMKRFKETRLSEFFIKICEITSAVTVVYARELPTGYAIS